MTDEELKECLDHTEEYGLELYKEAALLVVEVKRLRGELEAANKKCERLQIERDAVVENRDLTAEERDEAMTVAREILHSYPCFEPTTEEEEFKRDLAEKYPWLKEDGDG